MYQIIKPPKHLQKYIEHFWFGDDIDLPQKPNTYHSIATSKIELLFFEKGIYNLHNNGHEEPVSKNSFYGQTTNFKHYTAAAPRSSIFGITFSPLAALALFRIPASALSQQTIDLNNVLGNAGNELSDKINGANSFEKKAMMATNFFNVRLKELHLKYLSVEKLILRLEQTNINSIPQLIAQSYLSQRQFERNFKELTGFSASTYMKIKRFERFIESASKIYDSSECKMIDIALDLGYYDQAHLNRHFKEFTGLNPLTYFKNITLQ